MTDRYQVIITDLLNDELVPEHAVLDDLAGVTALHARCESELVGRIEQADAVILYHELTLTRATIDRLQKCRVIVRGGVGYDNVDGPAPGGAASPCATCPTTARRKWPTRPWDCCFRWPAALHVANVRLRDGREDWSYHVAAPLVRLRGRVLGIVGLGRIGTAMALRGKSLGMDVAFFDPYKPDGYDKALGIRRVETLRELLAQVVRRDAALPVDRRNPAPDRRRGAWPPCRAARTWSIRRAAAWSTARRCRPPWPRGTWPARGSTCWSRSRRAADDPLVAAWRDPRHAAHQRLILNPHVAWYCEDGRTEMRRKGAETCRRAVEYTVEKRGELKGLGIRKTSRLRLRNGAPLAGPCEAASGSIGSPSPSNP